MATKRTHNPKLGTIILATIYLALCCYSLVWAGVEKELHRTSINNGIHPRCKVVNLNLVTTNPDVQAAPTTTILDSISPTSGWARSFVTIRGRGLASVNAILFGSRRALTVTAINDSTIRAEVPDNASTGILSAIVGPDTFRSNLVFTVVPVPVPEIFSFAPTTAVAGNTQITIRGTRFIQPFRVTAAFVGNIPLSIIQITDNTMQVAIPANASTGFIELATTGTRVRSRSILVVSLSTNGLCYRGQNRVDTFAVAEQVWKSSPLSIGQVKLFKFKSNNSRVVYCFSTCGSDAATSISIYVNNTIVDRNDGNGIFCSTDSRNASISYWPATADTFSVLVSNRNCAELNALGTLQYKILPEATAEEISPEGGLAGTRVTIKGRNLSDVGAIRLNNTFRILPVGVNDTTVTWVAPITPGIYQVSLEILGRVIPTNLRFTICDRVQPPISASRAGGILCTGETIFLSSEVAQRYRWSTGDTTRTIAVRSRGNYFVDLTNGPCTRRSTTFIVQERPKPDVSLALRNDTLVAVPQTLSYDWSFNGVPFTPARNFIVNPQVGTYTVIGRLVSCTDTATFSITSLTDIGPSSVFEIYPNPAQNSFQIIMHESTVFKLVNVQGQCVYEKHLDQGQHPVYLTHAAPGIYYAICGRIRKKLVISQ